MSPLCPARAANRLGTYWTNRIGSKQVTLFKSDSHMSQDGPALANAVVWKQIIADCQPSWVITTGTGGGIGPTLEVGDVIVSRFVTFDCKREFKKFNGESFTCPTVNRATEFTSAESLFATNAAMLPQDNARPPKIISARSAHTGILTTDFFGFDNTANTYDLEGKGDLSEMGDAVLGMVCKELGADAPDYVIVRNVSDPQIDSTGTDPGATDRSGRQHLQGVRPVEFHLQCHRLLGDRRRSVRRRSANSTFDHVGVL